MVSDQNKCRYYLLYGVVTLLMVVVSAGCSNILNQEPNYKISSTDFFKNTSEVNQAVLGAYAQLQPMYRDQWKFTELRSDNTITQFNANDNGDFPIWYIDQFIMTPSNKEIQPYWKEIYVGIQRCNTVLNNIDEAKFTDKDKKDQLTGEAKFLRAFYYFDLVRLFGKVPLVLKQTESVSGAYATAQKRNSVDSVYTQIIKDATDAAELLPEKYSSDNKGRATKGAAKTLLGIIYLTRHKYSTAVDKFEDVRKLGYSLFPQYNDLYSPTNKYSNENIFSVQYTALDDHKGLGSKFIYSFAPLNSGKQITGDNAHPPQGLNIPTQSIFDAYEAGDERKSASIGQFTSSDNSKFGIAHGNTIYYVKKFDHAHTVRGVTRDNWPVYRYAQVLLMLAEAINEANSGPNTFAYGYVKQVRKRAGLGPLPSGLNQEEFRKAVYHEERVELAFEDHRWFNLLRTGRALKVMKNHAKHVKDIQPHLQEPVYEIEKYKLLYPIPKRLINLNPNLRQNPGWTE
jgi:hypothetical protein